MGLKSGGPGNGLTVITCDCGAPDCTERFNSYSVPSIVPVQAQNAKWALVEGKRVSGVRQPDKFYAPKHRPRPRMEKKHPEVADAWSAAVSKARK